MAPNTGVGVFLGSSGSMKAMKPTAPVRRDDVTRLVFRSPLSFSFPFSLSSPPPSPTLFSLSLATSLSFTLSSSRNPSRSLTSLSSSSPKTVVTVFLCVRFVARFFSISRSKYSAISVCPWRCETDVGVSLGEKMVLDAHCLSGEAILQPVEEAHAKRGECERIA